MINKKVIKIALKGLIMKTIMKLSLMKHIKIKINLFYLIIIELMPIYSYEE